MHHPPAAQAGPSLPPPAAAAAPTLLPPSSPPLLPSRPTAPAISGCSSSCHPHPFLILTRSLHSLLIPTASPHTLTHAKRESLEKRKREKSSIWARNRLLQHYGSGTRQGAAKGSLDRCVHLWRTPPSKVGFLCVTGKTLKDRTAACAPTPTTS